MKPFLICAKRATQFDVIAFASHIITLLSHTNDQVHIHGHFEPTAENLWPWVDNVRHVRALDIRGPLRHDAHVPEVICISREHKFLAYTKSLATFLEALKEADFEATSRKVVEKAKTLDELPHAYKKIATTLLDLTARTLDILLDHKERQRNLRFILDKIPVTLLVQSVRFINPMPFVEKLISIFVWKPPAMRSLLQVLGAMICGEQSSKKKMNEMKDGLNNEERAYLESLLELTEHLYDPKDRIHSMKRMADRELDARCIRYFKLRIRQKEKEDFVSYLASKPLTNFLKDLAHILPPLIDEISKVILVGFFF